MTDTLRSIAEGMEHRTVSGCSIPQWGELVARGLTHLDHDENCPKCRLEALRAEYEKVDLVKKWKGDADILEQVAKFGASMAIVEALRMCAAELETWLAVNLERIKAEARLEEAKWWSSPDREHGPRTLYLNEKERFAALEAQAKGKP